MYTPGLGITVACQRAALAMGKSARAAAAFGLRAKAVFNASCRLKELRGSAGDLSSALPCPIKDTERSRCSELSLNCSRRFAREPKLSGGLAVARPGSAAVSEIAAIRLSGLTAGR